MGGRSNTSPTSNTLPVVLLLSRASSYCPRDAVGAGVHVGLHSVKLVMLCAALQAALARLIEAAPIITESIQ